MLEMSENSSGAEQTHDVDAIMANAYSGESSSREMTQSEPTTTPTTPQAATPPEFKEYEFNARGQAIRIKDNDPRMNQWLSQGYDYAQNVNTLKQERETWDKSKNDWEGQISNYKEIDAYANENPEWWNHITQSYENRASRNEAVPDNIKSYLDQRLSSGSKDATLMKQFLQEMQTQKMEKQVSEEDNRLSESVKSIQAKYQGLDFSAKDQSGQSLEQRVLNHAITNNLPTFRAAFLDYYHDSLEQQAEARGREMVSSEMNKRKKLGLLDSPTPGKSFSFKESSHVPKNWSDFSLSSESILKEFNFG